jgi:hypothetical protein
MPRSTILLVLALICVQVARPDTSNLAGGVLIAHYPAGMPFSSDPPPGGWCACYLAGHALASCDDQVNRIDAATAQTWFVLAAWSESKEWRGIDFGLGEYSAEQYVITEHGPCFPSQGLTIPTDNWPGPNEGVSLAVTDSAWVGSLTPIYYFRGYSYGPETIPLAVNPNTQVAAAANALNPPSAYEFAALGAMGMQTDGTSVCPGGIVGEGEYLEVGVGVCCSEERCVPVAEPGCTSLGQEWEYHPEYTSCDPNPCFRMLRGDCTFPYTLHLPEGAALRYITWDFETTYHAGDNVVVDWQNGQLTINGRPYIPHPASPDPAYSAEFLQQVHGAVPLVQQLIQQQNPPDWHAAVKTYDRERSRLEDTVMHRYSKLIRQGMSAPEAAAACAERLRGSPLVDSAVVEGSDPSTRQSALRVVYRGFEGGGLLLLAPKDPWPTASDDFLNHRDACWRLRRLTWIEGAPGRKMVVRYGNATATRELED